MSQNQILEDLPVSPGAQSLIDEIAATRYPSELRRLSGAALSRGIAAGHIKPEEVAIVTDELAAKRQLLQPRMYGEQVVAKVATVTPTIEVPSYAINDAHLESLPSVDERDFDFRERAAGEHLDR